jgi:hypothetical protein
MKKVRSCTRKVGSKSKKKSQNKQTKKPNVLLLAKVRSAAKTGAGPQSAAKTGTGKKA